MKSVGDPAGSPAEGAHRIAVVVASFRDADLLGACLDSLEAACSPLNAPIVVARAGDGADVASVVEGRRGVTVVPTGSRSDVPQLRGVGMEATPPAAWVALTEDHCLAHPAWLERLLEATGPGVDVVGGSMGNARPGATEWAAYFSEYGFFNSRRATIGEPPLLTGANVAYSSRVVPEVSRRALRGEWENTIHGYLYAGGATLRWAPGARILQNGTYDVRAFCRDRFEHGHDYARTRLVEEEGASRWLLAAGAPLLPFLLTARVGRAAAPEAPLSFLRALPLTAVFLGAWSVGEAVGYVRGRP